MLASGVAGVQPVVGDVVERAPAGAGEQSGGRGVVDPEQRVGEAQAVRRSDDLLGQPRVGVRVDPAGQRLGALVEQSRPSADTVEGRAEPQSRPAPRPRPAARRRGSGRRGARRRGLGGRDRRAAAGRRGAGSGARRRPRPRGTRRRGPGRAPASQQAPVHRVGRSLLGLEREPRALDVPQVLAVGGPGGVVVGELGQQRSGRVDVAGREERRPSRTVPTVSRWPPPPAATTGSPTGHGLDDREPVGLVRPRGEQEPGRRHQPCDIARVAEEPGRAARCRGGRPDVRAGPGASRRRRPPASSPARPAGRPERRPAQGRCASPTRDAGPRARPASGSRRPPPPARALPRGRPC